MKALWIAALCLLTAAPIAAQEVHFSMGVENMGQLAREKTHHVRLGGNGHDVYFAASVEGKIVPSLRLMAQGRYMPTYLYVWPCKQDPCEELNRLSYRPSAEGTLATPVSISTIIIGLNFSPIHETVEVNAGGGILLVHGADYRFWGGVPMAVPAFSAESRVKLPMKLIYPTLPNLGVEGGLTFIPAGRRSRVIVLDEFSGSKQNGKPLTYRQLNWLAINLGVNVAI